MKVLPTAFLILFLASLNTVQAAPFVYITNESDENVSVIDVATNTVTATVDVGNTPQSVAITPDGTKAYVTNRLDNNVSVIDIATNTVTATVNVGDRPISVAITPDGTKPYVIRSAVDADILIFVIAKTPDGTKAYVSNTANDNVSVIDIATNTVTATVTVGNFPSEVAITPDGTKSYVGNLFDDNVSVIDIATNTVDATVTVGRVPIGVAITPPTLNLAARCLNVRSAFQSFFAIQLTWSASGSLNITSYNIRRDGVLIGSTSSEGPLNFTDTTFPLGKTVTYTVKEVTSAGVEGPAAATVTTGPCGKA